MPKHSKTSFKIKEQSQIVEFYRAEQQGENVVWYGKLFTEREDEFFGRQLAKEREIIRFNIALGYVLDFGVL